MLSFKMNLSELKSAYESAFHESPYIIKNLEFRYLKKTKLCGGFLSSRTFTFLQHQSCNTHLHTHTFQGNLRPFYAEFPHTQEYLFFPIGTKR